MNHEPSLWKRPFLFLWVAMWCILLVGSATWLSMYLVGTLGDPFAAEEQPAPGSEVFDSVVALTDEKVVRHLGEWELVEPKIPGHFHHIGRWYQADKWNFCIECHGPIPHSRTPKERAFLNMHNLFISCQVCHVREQEGTVPTRFGWIDITDGQLCSNPVMEAGVWGEYGAKIVPLKGPEQNPEPATLEEEQAFAAEFRRRMNKLGDRQKVIGNKFIHKRFIETPVRCSDCHHSEKAFLPYEALGYSSERAAFLVSAEVADLVARYEVFHIPNLLKTDEQVPPQTGEKTE
ncbi:MAG: hypothetical protein JSU70_22135 [Phycisphaerales bacterium]|nr:MAG: hypothetical protein JSU70_22135 [Phycisphaerales bacterium]